MGALVAKIAFPHPPKDYSEKHLKERRDLKSLTTKSGLKIPAIHVARAGADFTIIYSHGNAEDVGLSLFLLDLMSQELDCSVIGYEYPGYSISDGEPSEENCYEAIDAAYHYATKIVEVDPKKIVFYGRSLGTGPSVDICSRTPDIAGCILESPLESGIRCAIGVCTSITLYPLDIFKNYSKIEMVECPVLIMHGEDDTVVPIDNGKALYSQLQTRPFHESVDYHPLWVENAGHNDMPRDVVLKECRRFLRFLKRRKR